MGALQKVEANLRNACLKEVDLYMADLSGAELDDSDLRGADLCTADVSEVFIDPEQLKLAIATEDE